MSIKMDVKIFLVCSFVFQLLLSLEVQNEIQTVCIIRTRVSVESINVVGVSAMKASIEQIGYTFFLKSDVYTDPELAEMCDLFL